MWWMLLHGFIYRDSCAGCLRKYSPLLGFSTYKPPAAHQTTSRALCTLLTSLRELLGVRCFYCFALYRPRPFNPRPLCLRLNHHLARH